MSNMTVKKPAPVQASKAAAALAFAPQAGGKVTRLNANIKIELHRALKARAAIEGRTIGDLIEEWIEGFAKK